MPTTSTAMPSPDNLTRRRLLQVAGTSMAMSAAGVFSLTSARASSRGRLHILHINDSHSRLEPAIESNATCAGSGVDRCLGGAARIATAVRQRRAALAAGGLPMLVLDAGDQGQGSLFYTAHGGRAEMEMMNLIGFDATTLGNHEFNRGSDALAEMLAMAAFPVVSGNTIVAPAHPLAGLVRDHLMIERDGLRVGILGVTTPDTALLSSPGEGVRLADPVAHLRAAAAQLRAEDVHNILVLSHLGVAQDQALAATVEGISLIVGGHSHTLMSNTVPGAPDYATLVASPAGRAVPIVQAYAFSHYLGEVSVEFDSDGAVVAATGDTIELSAEAFAEAEDVAARIAVLAGPVERLRATRLTFLEADIDGRRIACRSGACAMGNTVADAMVARMRSAGVTIAITNGGGIRDSLSAGPITLGDVLTVLPFQNTLYTLELSGAVILAALEHGVSGLPEGGGRFPQVSGLRFRLDASRPSGAGRVSEVAVLTPGGRATLDAAARYAVVTNSFLARGGDGYAMFAAAAPWVTTPPAIWPMPWPSIWRHRRRACR